MKTIIKICLCFAIIIFCKKSTAQVVDTSTTQKLLQYIMQPLDKNQIPTGFLEEYGCPILPAGTFNGSLTDSNRIDMNLWRTLYLQLQTGWTRATANPLPTITSVNTTIKQNVGNTLPVPIPLLIASYNTVKSNAFTSNLLSYNSSTKRVSDVAGRTQSPYDPKVLFAACPNKNISLKGSESFIIQSNMIWNNTSKTISQIQIDFANGQGFQNVTVGTAINVSYTDTGFKKWTIKVTLNDNSILQCFNEYNVLKTANIASRFQTGESVPVLWGNINSVGGTRAAATVWVNFSRNNFTGTLRKPLIIVEGYDVNFIAPSLQPYNYSITDFINGIDEPKLQYDFNYQLDDIAGYDLVFVDFADGAADIVLNAGAVQEVINRVNANKVNDTRFGNIRQQNVVMGLSMGGLCARYALANMTKNFPGTPTETRLLITHDSPHQGANVPLGLQYLLRMVGSAQLFGNNILDIYPDYNDVIGLLNAPATQQLLTYRSLTANTFASNNFLGTTYRNMVTFAAGNPQPTYRFIATSLGNECASPVYNPYTQLLNVSADGFIFFFPLVSYRLRTIAETYALPAAGNTSKIARFKLSSKFKLFGFITIAKDYYDNTAYAPGNHLAIDGVPGAVTEYASTTLPSFKVLFPIPGIFGFFGYISANASGTPGKFTFVSTASALDAGPYTTPVFSQKYVNGSNQNYPSTTETFIAQETSAGTSNNVHIRFTARNSRWLFNEMENLPNLENCSGECANPYFIAGTDPICSSGTFSIAGLQRGVALSWTVTPQNLVTSFATGNSITLTRIGPASGVVTLTANLGAGCSAATSISRQVKIGLSSSDISINVKRNNTFLQNVTYGPFEIAKSIFTQTGNFNLTASSSVAGTNSFTWAIFTTGGYGYTNFNPVGANCSFTLTGTNAPTIPLSVTLNNTLNGCTSTITNYLVVVGSIPGARMVGINVSPNPATSTLNLSIIDDNNDDLTASAKKDVQRQTPVRPFPSTGKTIVSLFDFNTSSLVRQWTQNEASSKMLNYSIAGLRKGLYVLQVDRDNETISTKLIVE